MVLLRPCLGRLTCKKPMVKLNWTCCTLTLRMTEKGRADLAEPMFEPIAEHVVEESDSNVDMPSTKQVADLETIESELADVNSGERIAQFQKVQGTLTVTNGPQEEEQDACQMDQCESDVFEINSQNQSQSSDFDDSCEGQLLTVYESCGSDADGAAVIENRSTEKLVDDYTVGVGGDTLDTVKEDDIEVVKVLGEESDLPQASLPELGTYRNADLEVCFVKPGLEQSQE